MESIRINIHKQLGRDGLVPVISYPAESAYDFRIRSCKDDMTNLSTDTAYRICVYPDGHNLQASLIKPLIDGFIEYSILLNISQKTVDGQQLTDTLDQLAATYEQLAASDPKPNENRQFKDAVSNIYRKLTDNAAPGNISQLPVPEKEDATPLTYYMNYKTKGEISTLIRYPDQEFFRHTSVIYLVGEKVVPTRPQQCKHIHSIVLRSFKIKSPQGHEYGEVKEGETVRVSLLGKEGMLPMTTDVRGDVTNPTPYGYFDTATSTIRIDERTIKFYYELKFIVKHNGRVYRSCTVRYNGEQVMPDSNGCYLIKVYEDRVNDAGYIQFSGENFKNSQIQVTPGIVKQQEYVFNPEPQHDITYVTLDFGDGHPIETSIDVGTNDRLFNQLHNGKVKGYRVKQEGDSFRMFIPRKLTATSKNILRLFKLIAMVLFTLLAYALLTWLATKHWPWPIEQWQPTEKVAAKTRVNTEGEVTTVKNEDDDDYGLIVDDRDQVTLEAIDQAYLRDNNIWRKDSIKSNKYKDVINTIFNGRISEIKMKNYNGKVIDNEWWMLLWRNVIIPNNIHNASAKEVFQQVITPDHNSLDVQVLYEELTKRLLPTGDVISPGKTSMGVSAPKRVSAPATTPSTATTAPAATPPATPANTPASELP